MQIFSSTMSELIEKNSPHFPDNAESITFTAGTTTFTKKKKRHKSDGVYLYRIDEDFYFKTDYLGISFHSDWLTIDEDGLFTIKKGYAWDGNSFKFNILDLCVIGIPDGIINVKTMHQKTYYASLVHDALYQYYGFHGLPRKTLDQVYLDFARKNYFILSSFYYGIIRFFGGWSFAGQEIKKREVEGKVYYLHTSFSEKAT